MFLKLCADGFIVFLEQILFWLACAIVRIDQ